MILQKKENCEKMGRFRGILEEKIEKKHNF
jgi:hypothetical protein